MPSAHRSDACRLARLSAVRITVVVRSQISVGSCSTQPACGRICSCSSWWRATSLPPWSKIMKRVLVVPWSTAPTKSAMVVSSDVLAGLGHGDRFPFGGQEAFDHVAEDGAADDAADDRRDDRQPPIGLAVLVDPGGRVPGDVRREPGPEVAGRVDGVAR